MTRQLSPTARAAIRSLRQAEPYRAPSALSVLAGCLAYTAATAVGVALVALALIALLLQVQP